MVVTGLSGAGKTQALRALEDLGFYCVDNPPPKLLETFADLILDSRQRIQKVGLVIDIRGGEFFGDLLGALDALQARGIWHRLVYLDADDDVLLRRFEETRRKHPLTSEGGLAESIRDEREMLRAVRNRADVIVDTTKLAPNLLKRQLAALLLDVIPSGSLLIQVISFGFKHGLPVESDLVFDIRFLPNPHHEPDLRHFTGLDPEVKQYVAESAEGKEFLRRLREFLVYLIPQYATEGKAYLTISIGCTGGRHRSVLVAEEVAAWVREMGYPVSVSHRDLHLASRAAASRVPATAEAGAPAVNAATSCQDSAEESIRP